MLTKFIKQFIDNNLPLKSKSFESLNPSNFIDFLMFWNLAKQMK